jgi:hypothetical protein
MNRLKGDTVLKPKYITHKGFGPTVSLPSEAQWHENLHFAIKYIHVPYDSLNKYRMFPCKALSGLTFI